MRTVSLEELLEAGCHFGHQISRQNAKARDYIFEARDGIHIIDLEKTKEGLEEAAEFIKDIAKNQGTLLVVGTKRQAQSVIEEEKKNLKKAEIDGVYFVTKRWIGGTLTNASEVAKNYKKLKDIAVKLKDPTSRSKYTKKELSDLEKMRQKLEGFYGDIAEMSAVPNALLIIDTHEEHVAADEAVKAGIPTVGLTDTNADPTIITHPIPANDDAVGSIKLLVTSLIDAWIEGRKSPAKQEKETSENKTKEKEETSDKKEEKKEAEEKSKSTKEDKPKKVVKKKETAK